jgi:hypothetical protein
MRCACGSETKVSVVSPGAQRSAVPVLPRGVAGLLLNAPALYANLRNPSKIISG